MGDKDLVDFFEYQLPIFDEILAQAKTPLKQRPFFATMDFIEYCIVDIKNESKENMLEKPWFRFFYQQIAEWYSQRYGDAMKGNSEKHALGVVLIYGTPFEVQIPLSVTDRWESPTERWFCWPNEVLEQENVLDWIVNPPNFERMSMEELSSMKTCVIDVVNSIRTLRINLMTATKEDAALRKLADGIPSHIEKSGNDILSMSGATISSSVWELHLAMEKALKLLVRQRGKNPGNTHDLANLLDKANSLEGISLDVALLHDLPSHHDAIRHRYGEAPELAIDRAVMNYRIALTVVTEVTAALSRRFFMKNARFLIKVPPWQS